MLDYINQYNIMSPLLVLNILRKPNNESKEIHFSVVRKYLLEYVQKQNTRIDKNTVKFKDESVKIKSITNKIAKLKHTPTDFESNTCCEGCKRILFLPTVHFMCRHVFCDQCAGDINGIRKCPICQHETETLIEMHEERKANQHDTDTFFRKLEVAHGQRSDQTELDIIGSFCGKDIFSGINDPLLEESK